MQSGFDRFRSNAEVRCCFLNVHLLHLAHDEDEAEGFREGVHCVFQKPPYFALRCGALWIGLCVHGGELNNLRARFLRDFDAFQGDRCSLLASAPKRFIQSDARQPGRK